MLRARKIDAKLEQVFFFPSLVLCQKELRIIVFASRSLLFGNPRVTKTAHYQVKIKQTTIFVRN